MFEALKCLKNAFEASMLVSTKTNKSTITTIKVFLGFAVQFTKISGKKFIILE